MRGGTASCLAGALLVVVVSGAWAGPEISALRPMEPEVARYGCFELSFRLDRDYDNPFDPRQVEVNGHFRTPEGAGILVPGFFMQPYRNVGPGGLTISNPFEQRWEKSGEACWRVRFCPTAVGN